MMANRNKIVMVAALDGTFERKPFGNIINLIPKAEKVTKLNAVCV
jgi:thymidine kinase